MRPTDFDITDAVEDDEVVMIWVTTQGRTICISIPHGAIENRKLLYGLAEVTIRQRKAELPTEEVRDLVPDADEEALRGIVAEHFDRFEEAGVDWKEQNPPQAEALRAIGRRDRADLKGRRPLPERAPQIQQPARRRT